MRRLLMCSYCDKLRQRAWAKVHSVIVRPKAEVHKAYLERVARLERLRKFSQSSSRAGRPSTST